MSVLFASRDASDHSRELWNKGIRGTIPAEIGVLTALQTLHLYGNELHGTLPGTMANLTKLERIYLQAREPQTTARRGFRASVPRAPDRRLQMNKLSGEIPSFLGDLPDLVKMCACATRA